MPVLTDEQLDELSKITNQFHYEHCAGVGVGGAWLDCDCAGQSLLDTLTAEVAALRTENETLTAHIAVLDDDADAALDVRDEAIEAESQAGDRIAAELAAERARHETKTVALAAVEAVVDDFFHGAIPNMREFTRQLRAATARAAVKPPPPHSVLCDLPPALVCRNAACACWCHQQPVAGQEAGT